MSDASIVLVGLGPGSADALTLGALRTLRDAGQTPIYLRTRVHPTVEWLESNERVVFAKSFDDRYESADTFEQIYEAIADEVLSDAIRLGRVIFAVPGHPLVGEKTVLLLLERAAAANVSVEIVAAVSFVDTVLSASRREVAEFKVVDALGLPDLQTFFHAFEPPFDVDRANIVYQVYDRDVASRVKLALLEYYPAEHDVLLVGGDQRGAARAKPVALSALDWPEQSYDHLTSIVVPPLPKERRRPDFYSLLDVMAQLREPDRGCPWDRVQTPETLRKYLLEEAYEVLDALDTGDPDKYAEELGDLLLQVVFHAQLAREDAQFTIEDVIGRIVSKLIRRHPHVFGDVDVSGADDVLKNWEAIKRTEKGYEDRKSILDGVVRMLPALSRAQEISKRAAKAGFEWDSIDGVFEKLAEEIEELKEARAGGDRDRVAEEMGDLLFTAVNLARFEKVDAEDALQRMVNRFIKRFNRIESEAEARRVRLEELSQAEMEVVWQAAKREESHR